MGVKISKHYSTLLQLWFFANQTFPECSLWQPSQKLLIGILKFQIQIVKKKIQI